MSSHATPAGFDTRRRFVRVTGERPNGFVEFDFAVGEPDLAVEMIKVGESTGALTEMLANVSEFYDEEIEARLSRLVSAIEPLILVFMGGVIAVLLYAFYLPLFRLSQVGM